MYLLWPNSMSIQATVTHSFELVTSCFVQHFGYQCCTSHQRVGKGSISAHVHSQSCPFTLVFGHRTLYGFIYARKCLLMRIIRLCSSVVLCHSHEDMFSNCWLTRAQLPYPRLRAFDALTRPHGKQALTSTYVTIMCFGVAFQVHGYRPRQPCFISEPYTLTHDSTNVTRQCLPSTTYW